MSLIVRWLNGPKALILSGVDEHEPKKTKKEERKEENEEPV